MYHSRFIGTHREAGRRWGALLYKNGRQIVKVPSFCVTEERKAFARACFGEYEKYYPEVLEEIRGIAEGQKIAVENLYTFLFSMYCFEFSNRCTCFAFQTETGTVFGRNSDFLTELEKLCDSCLYRLKNSYSFVGNTTAFTEIEDGVNEYGLAVGLTFVYPKIRKPGLNAGMIVRYLLETCKNTSEALAALQTLPIASAQTLTLADPSGDIAVVECNPEKMTAVVPERGECFVVAANHFTSAEMSAYKKPDFIDDWNSAIRYQTARQTLKNERGRYSLTLAKELLSGKYGFMCQYDRETGADTVWSSVCELSRGSCKIYRAEGNPSGNVFGEDKRLHFR